MVGATGVANNGTCQALNLLKCEIQTQFREGLAYGPIHRHFEQSMS